MLLPYTTTSEHHPTRAWPHDAGWDLCANENATIFANDWDAVSTGLKIGIPVGWVGMIVSRSGLALNHGVFVMNSPGIIDAGYTGEIKVILANLNDKPFYITEGDRIAQLLLFPKPDVTMLPGTVWEGNRGDNGFGSSGR